MTFGSRHTAMMGSVTEAPPPGFVALGGLDQRTLPSQMRGAIRKGCSPGVPAIATLLVVLALPLLGAGVWLCPGGAATDCSLT